MSAADFALISSLVVSGIAGVAAAPKIVISVPVLLKICCDFFDFTL